MTPFVSCPDELLGELSDQGPRRDGKQRGVVWVGRDRGHHGLFLRKTQTINKVLAGRLTYKPPRLGSWLNHFEMEGGLQAPRPAAPAEAGGPAARRLVCGAALQKEQGAAPFAAMAFHPSFLRGGSAMCNLRALGHQNPVATKDNVQEDQMRHKPGTKLSYEHTINR